MPKTFSARGFTLIELLVAISLAAIIGLFGLASYNSFNRRQIVEQNAKKIVSDIRLAQNLALSQQKPEAAVCTCTTLKSYSFVVDKAAGSYKIIPNCIPPCSSEISIKSVQLQNVSLSKSDLEWIKFSVLSQGVGITPASGRLIIEGRDGLYSKEIIIGTAGELKIQ